MTLIDRKDINLSEKVKEILFRKGYSHILQKAIHENRIINEHYLQLRKIEQQTANQEKIIKLLQEMKITVSRQAYKNITAK